MEGQTYIQILKDRRSAHVHTETIYQRITEVHTESFIRETETHIQISVIKVLTYTYSDCRSTDISNRRRTEVCTKILVTKIIEFNTTLREGQGNPIRASKICNPQRGLPSFGYCKFWTWIGFPRPSLNVVIDYFSHSCLKI